ncbi:MAG: segregation/condensation protein A [Bdellovibrionales bacterium]|nr:segregation/condensation protein A [Bdellovibrionales bacterium]
MYLNVQTEKFSGPLGLLLYLIRREEMDIFDININEITKQYLAYIKAMKKLDLELAGEFIAMAATLIQIKSKMLLPQYNEEGEEEVEADPRKELVQKLLEYQKFQDISQQLYERPLVGRDTWLRGQRLKISVDVEEEIITEENALFSLIRSYRHAIKNMKKTVHKVGAEMQSIAERILELKDRFIVGVKTSFFNLVPEEKRSLNTLLVTFLSLLELTRMGFISVFQSENFADIHIETKKNIDGDVVSKAENFENANTQALAESITSGNEVVIPEDMDFDEDEVEGQSIQGEEKEVLAKIETQMDLLDDEENEYIPGEEFVEAATDEEILAEEELLAKEDSFSEDQSQQMEPEASQLNENSTAIEGDLV